MARGVDFDGSNVVYKAPEGREDVADLHVFANGKALVSCWELTPEELAEVNRTGRVFLSVLSGRVFYPSYVGSESSVRALVADYGPIWKKSND